MGGLKKIEDIGTQQVCHEQSPEVLVLLEGFGEVHCRCSLELQDSTDQAQDAAEQATRVKAAEQRAQQWGPKPGKPV